MKEDKFKKSYSVYSDKQLTLYKYLFFICGILILIGGLLLLFVSVFLGLFFIALGIIEIRASEMYKAELLKRKCDSACSNFVPLEKNSNTTSSDLALGVNTEHHNIAGVSFRQKEIKSLGEKNDYYSMSKRELVDECMYDEDIYQLEFSPSSVELVEEPENEYDPNAIKVIVDCVHVGYIKKGSCSHIKKLLHENRILNITADIHGGKYKRISCEYDFDSDKDTYELETGETDFFVSIYLELKS